MSGLYKNAEEATAGIQQASQQLEASLHTLAYRIADGIEQPGVGAYVIGPYMENDGEQGMAPAAWAYDETVAQKIASALGWVYREAPKTNAHRKSAVIASTPEQYNAIIRDEKDGE